jgi:methylmalonyl-CoA mutase N-terminal domain/subunit
MTSTRDLRSARSEGDGGDERELERLRAEVAEWRRRYANGELRDIAFSNSEREVDPLYTRLDVPPQTSVELGVPGEYPYTRGIHPTGYRGRLWT